MDESSAPPTKECPLCGGSMVIKTTETVLHVPGNPVGTTRTSSEWVCSDCDYFEEVEEEG